MSCSDAKRHSSAHARTQEDDALPWRITKGAARRGRGLAAQRQEVMRRTATKRLTLLAMLLIFIMLCASIPALADVQILTADSISATRGVTTPANAYGMYDGAVASETNVWRQTNDVMTMTLSNYNATGTILNVTFGIRTNIVAGAWVDDAIDIQYSNDTGTNWYTAQPAQQPPGTLTIYGNYTVLGSIWSAAQLDNTQVRLRYILNGGRDNVRSGIDGVELHVTYAPPPNVSLTSPEDGALETDGTVAFNFTPSSQLPAGFRNCSLYINTSGTLSINATNQTQVVNGTNNTIAVTLNDGDYLWNVTCFDASGFSGTGQATRVLHVHRPTAVSLVAPADDGIATKSFVNFTFNVTSSFSIASCILVVDDAQQNSYTSPPKGVNVTTNDTLPVGDHWWYINCTDSDGFTTQSEKWNVSVQITIPTIITDKNAYDPGSTVQYNGTNWQPGAYVTLNVTLANGTAQVFNLTASAQRRISMTQFINYSYPAGQYNVTAYQQNDTALNASATYIVNARPWIITADKASYLQGEWVNITGLGYAPDSTANITINFSGGMSSVLILVNSTGGFSYEYQLPYNEVLGRHNVTGQDRNYSALFANTSFDVILRVSQVTANKTYYQYNESVGITGVNFSLFGTLALQIFNTITGKPGRGFPTTVAADQNGNFSYAWNANNTCSGNYTVQADDQDQPALFANTTFVINNSLSQQVQSITDGVSGNRVTPLLSNVNANDANRQGVISGANDGYLRFTFHPNIPVNATNIFMNISVVHRASANAGGNRVTSYNMYFVNSSGALSALTTPGCTFVGNLAAADSLTTCSLDMYVPNASAANSVTIMVNYTRTGTANAQVNFAYVNVSWLGDPYGCFDFGTGPSAPTVSGMSAPADPVVLNAGTMRMVECNFTVTDANGAADITGANATFYTPPSTLGSADSNVSKYMNTSCDQVGAGVNSKDFICSVQLLYYAVNGTWTCSGTGISNDGAGSGTTTFSVDPLFAINITDALLDFGSLNTSDISANITTNVTNIGNQQINISAYGYGAYDGDGNAFNCTTQNISAMWLHFAANSTAGYNVKENLSGSYKQLRLWIDPQNTPAQVRTNNTYWQVQIPPTLNETGLCTGTIVFQAEMG